MVWKKNHVVDFVSTQMVGILRDLGMVLQQLSCCVVQDEGCRQLFFFWQNVWGLQKKMCARSTWFVSPDQYRQDSFHSSQKLVICTITMQLLWWESVLSADIVGRAQSRTLTVVVEHSSALQLIEPQKNTMLAMSSGSAIKIDGVILGGLGDEREAQ